MPAGHLNGSQGTLRKAETEHTGHCFPICRYFLQAISESGSGIVFPVLHSGGTNTCGPWYQDSGADRNSEFYVWPQHGGPRPATASAAGRSASRAGRSRAPGSLFPEKSRSHHPRHRSAICSNFFERRRRPAPAAGALHPAPSVLDQGRPDHPTGNPDTRRHRPDRSHLYDLRRGPGHGEGQQR